MKTLQEKNAEEVVEEFKRDSSVVGIEICGSLARGEIKNSISQYLPNIYKPSEKQT